MALRDTIRAVALLMDETFVDLSDYEFSMLDKCVQDEHRAAKNLIEALEMYILTIDQNRRDE